jgi:hypothetical protein
MNFSVQLADNRVPGIQVDRVRPAAVGEPAGIAFGSPEFQKR